MGQGMQTAFFNKSN